MTANAGQIARSALYIAAASLLWAVMYLILKRASGDLGPFTISFIQAFAGAIAAAAVYRISPRAAVKAAKQGGWPMVLMAVLGVTVANSVFVFGLRHIDLGVGAILEKTQPIFTVILAAMFLKERLTFVSICLGLLGIIGSMQVIPLRSENAALVQDNAGTLLGVGACLIAAFVWAIGGVLGRKLAVGKLGPSNMAFLRASIGAATVLPLSAIFEWPFMHMVWSWQVAGIVCLGGAIDSVLCYVLYYRGLQHLSAGVTSIVEVLTPVGSVLLGVLVLAEHLTLRQCLGALVVLVAVTALVGNEIRVHAKSVKSLEKHP